MDEGLWASIRATLLAAVILLAGFGTLDRADASTVTGFTATASTYSAGASAVEYAVTFTATTAIPAQTGYVELTAPTGATFSSSNGSYHVQANGTSPSVTRAFNVTVSPGGAGQNVVQVFVPNAISAGATVQVDAYEATNPPAAVSGGQFSMFTSADTTSTTPVGFSITGTTAVSGVSAATSASSAGSQEVEDTVTFTAATQVVFANTDTFPTQCLDGECNQGDVFLTAPAGTVFDSYIADYAIKDLTNPTVPSQTIVGAAADPNGLGNNVIQLAPGFTIAAGDQIQVTAAEVENPSSANSSGMLSVSTTSDVISTAVSFPITAPIAAGNVLVATTSATAGATHTGYLIGLTTTQALPFDNSGSDGTGWVSLTLPTGTSATGLGGAGGALVSDAAHPTPVQSPGVGEFGYHLSDNQVDVAMPFAVPANTALTITLPDSTNSTPFAYPAVSTSADTVQVPAPAPSSVIATAGNVSASVSWTAIGPSPGVAIANTIVTPFAGSNAQAPYNTDSSASSATVPGLTNGTAYSFEVATVYADGATDYVTPTSASSNLVTPSGGGNGPPVATPSTPTLSFGTQFLGQTTAPQTVQLFNTGSSPLDISSVSVTGAGGGDFSIGADSCAGQAVASGQSCTVSVSFTPSASGSRSDALAFADNASGSPQTVALVGTGTDTATVTGTVVRAGSQGAPVAGATVRVLCSASSCGAATTDAAGHYTISGLPLGAAEVAVNDPATLASESNATLRLGVQTINVTLTPLQPVGSGVTVTGAQSQNGFPDPVVGDPLTVDFGPKFPAEPAGTKLVYFTTVNVSEVDTNPPVLGNAGAVALLVDYGAGGKATVTAQYADTQSGVMPAFNFLRSSPGASQSDTATTATTALGGPILVQYLPDGQLQTSLDPREFYPGTKAFTTCSSYAVLPGGTGSIQVQAKPGRFDLGAVSPAPTVVGCNARVGASINFNLYFDPSGTVQSTKGIPLESATVTLFNASQASGPFKVVPNGSTIMATTNRRNPDHTTALGQFGWDTLPGYYRITARHPGCTAGPHRTTAQTRAYKVPPPVSGIVIKLTCPHLRRARSRVRLRTVAMRGTMTAVNATVSGRHPVGSVRFSAAGGPTVTLAISPRSKQATLVLTKRHQRFTASYLGDANNAPSVARGRSR